MRSLPAEESLLTRAYRFGRALIVGSGATITDFSVFTTCVRAIGIGPAEARLPALLAGACFQFFGNRSFTFRAQAGNISRQARLFVIFEALTLALNFGLFRLLLPRLPNLPPELVTFIGTFATFVAFAYPVRRLVIFKLPPNEAPP